MPFRRTSQVVCLAIFLLSLAGAGKLAASDIYLRMDPALTGIAALAGRVLSLSFLPALIILFSAVAFGRIFCGYICPMGTTIDGGDVCLAGPGSGYGKRFPAFPRLKYYILAFIAGAALTGVTFVFWAAPLSLITRFYGLIVYPVVLLVSDTAVSVLYPLASRLDIRTLMFSEIPTPKYATQIFVLVFFIAVFSAARLSPRFWCRYLCPSGALLALASRKPLIRRQVDSKCNQCGICALKCPMGAIEPESPQRTHHSECIACLECVRMCPQKAISFGFDSAKNSFIQDTVSSSRRQFLFSSLAGAGTAALGLTGLNAVRKDHASKGVVRPMRLIRPPGALPEPKFLALCVRCGQCMSACPTNTLQPVWFEAGFLGMFSPAVIPRRKYCDPTCISCGQACPTGAIFPIPKAERPMAKIGTAVIYRQQCLAWEYKKSCMVCDEVCPYDALKFEKRPGFPYPVPHVIEDKCSGCGYCEHSCPVYNRPAIFVTPMNEMRLLPADSFESEAKNRGFNLRLHSETGGTNYPGGSGPGVRPQESGGLPPGFDEGG